jgi:hypothetical protein
MFERSAAPGNLGLEVRVQLVNLEPRVERELLEPLLARVTHRIYPR